jgi:hypothetical protein
MSRTIMLSELRQLFEAVPDTSASHDCYVHCIEQENCLRKRSSRTRLLTTRHLSDLYALRPETTVFRTLRYFWQRDSEGRALLALLCAYGRDPLLRTSAPYVLDLHEGQPFSRTLLEAHLEEKYPGRFSKATLRSTSQNLASSWTQSGHLAGRVKKVRTAVTATAGVTAYALLLGFLAGARGEGLFTTEYARLLDCTTERAMELAGISSGRGWLTFKRIGQVVEVLFPVLITEREMEWIREQS